MKSSLQIIFEQQINYKYKKKDGYNPNSNSVLPKFITITRYFPKKPNHSCIDAIRLNLLPDKKNEPGV